jgi:hypothetical protein
MIFQSLHFLLLSAFVISNTFVFAQTLEKITFGVGGNIVYTTSFNSAKGDDQIIGTQQTFRQYADSVRKYEHGRFTSGISVWGTYAIKQKLYIQSGITYINMGFSRTQSNIRFRDRMFPGMGASGRLEELSSSEKSVEYRYRYHYLQIPILINAGLYKARDASKALYLTGGISGNILLKHDMKAVLNQFVIEGKDIFNFDSTGYEGRRLGINILAGVRFETRDADKQRFYIQPQIGFSPFSVSRSPISVMPLYIQISTGLIFTTPKR